MTEPLSPERFAELADAYGGAVARWPEGVRFAALALARDPAMAAMLAEAERLDAPLDAWRVAPPSPALCAVILERRPRPWGRRARLWWSGLGIAAAAAGAVAGSIAVAATLPADHGAEESTAFGNLAVQED